jgi:hypothetical protein
VLRRIIATCFLLTFLTLASVALAQDFSADVIENKRGNQAPGKLYATKAKVRYEPAERDPRMGSFALVLDESTDKSLVIMQDKHMYMDAMPGMTNPVITKFWTVDDVNDACPQWKKVAEQLKADENWGSCSKVGSDTLNGRSTVKYEGVSKDGKKEYYWVDTKLKCVIKTDSGSGSFELRNIQEGSQPASLFEVPSGYTKFDMGSMMRQQQ